MLNWETNIYTCYMNTHNIMLVCKCYASDRRSILSETIND